MDGDTTEFCPYVGLRPFRPNEQAYFHGRALDTRRIVANLFACPVTVLYGASGVGKSSALHAGVVPAIQSGGKAICIFFANWSSPGFLEEIRGAIGQAVASKQFPDPSLQPSPLDELLAKADAGFPRRICLIFDQFEEYLLYHHGRPAGDEFERQLARAVNLPGENDFGVLISLREDALSRLDPLTVRIPALLGNNLPIHHLDATSAEQAIREPLAVYSLRHAPVSIEDELVAALLRDVRIGSVRMTDQGGRGKVIADRADPRIETAFLQLVLTRLWNEEQRAASSVLRKSTYERLGRAPSIVREYLRTVMRELPPIQRDIASAVFPFLVTPTGAKIAQTEKDLALSSGFPIASVSPVVRELRDRRILTGQDGEKFEIFHDVLAPAILDWRAEYRRRKESKRQIRRVIAAAAAVIVLILAVGLFWIFEQQKRERMARVRELAAASRERMSAGEAPTGAWLALHAAAMISPSPPEVQEALLSAVAAWRSSTVLKPILAGPGRIVMDVQGRNAAAIDGQGSIIVPDLVSTREPIRISAGAAISAAGMSWDGQFIAVGRGDGSIEIWAPRAAAAQRSQKILSLPRSAAGVTALAFSPDSARLAAGDIDGGIAVWDLTGTPKPKTLDRHVQRIHALAFSEDARSLAAASEDGTASILDPSTGRARARLAGHNQPVLSIGFDSKALRVITGGADGTARIWSRDGAPLTVLRGHEGPVIALAFSPDGYGAATASSDKSVRIWDLMANRQISRVDTEDAIRSLAFDPAGNLSGMSARGGVYAWKPPLVAHRMTASASRVDFHPGGKILAAADDAGEICLLRRASSDAPFECDPLSGRWSIQQRVTGVAMSPDGQSMAVGGVSSFAEETSRLQIFSLTGQANRLFPQDSGVTGVSYSAGGDLLAAVTVRCAISLISPGLQEEQHWDLGPERTGCNDIALDPRGRFVAVGTSQGLLVGDPKTRTVRMFPNSGFILKVAISPDGKQIAAAGEGAVRIWDPERLREIRGLYGHTGQVNDVRFDRGGRRLVTAGADGTVRLWNVNQTWPVATLPLYFRAAHSAAFSPSGDRIASCGDDQTVRIFPIEEQALRRTVSESAQPSISPAGCERFLRMSACPVKP